MGKTNITLTQTQLTNRRNQHYSQSEGFCVRILGTGSWLDAEQEWHWNLYEKPNQLTYMEEFADEMGSENW